MHSLLYSHLVTDFTLSRNIHMPSRNVVRHTSLDDTEHGQSLVPNPSFSEHKPCEDPRPQLSGALAEPRLFTDEQLARQRPDSALDLVHCFCRLGLSPLKKSSGEVSCELRFHHKRWLGTIRRWLIKKHGAFKHDGADLGSSAVDHTSHFQTWLVHAEGPNRNRT